MYNIKVYNLYLDDEYKMIIAQVDKMEDLSKLIGCSIAFISKAIKEDLSIYTALRLTSKNDKIIALLSGVNTKEKQKYKVEKINI